MVPLGGTKHRLWLSELPASGSAVVLDLPLDANFELRVQAARRLWLALERRPLGTPPLAVPALQQRRLILALRALDGWQEGNSYRQIAKGLFGSHRIAERGWKTDDLRSRTIRLVKLGRRLMRLRCRASSTRADARTTVHELLGDQRHTSVLCSQFFWHGTIANRMRSLRSDLSLWRLDSCNREALSS
ncbi:Uncharacterized conserved protein [Bradyrhizobium shewense]|uniref:Uncharacterized conserved protein n=1 Tax=Bradyrhizobium shewense TaxID=1761772 RepID=A0A1C3XTK7_9BRAD|nr:DUF2285 domain-containing protein [Bradyrhizobium shewense]SCB55593.1 Uncharacterized conserved protein [Bradyrhizobium shewense]